MSYNTGVHLGGGGGGGGGGGHSPPLWDVWVLVQYLVYTLAIALTNQTVYVVSGSMRNSLRGCKFKNSTWGGGVGAARLGVLMHAI